MQALQLRVVNCDRRADHRRLTTHLRVLADSDGVVRLIRRDKHMDVIHARAELEHERRDLTLTRGQTLDAVQETDALNNCLVLR